ncbi:YycH family regulatory protein [Thermoactinomyces mirandus]|uniref:Regulatory protein YycH domain-containing protein n=1 Tax=Thermoactinomyces mirandus TaxID=2756294 RepID=A0A7W1XTD2_9BACL|nr:two-component system activity regulator YycH [Thermoactinomyces mirandus]MBA4602894.1 hypothetical protein [Thermoactinomyces mirandus]
MNKKWSEHLKTGLLISLVLASFVLTGLLWKDAPGDRKKPYDPLESYTINHIYDEKYNERKVYQVAAPNQMIVHMKGSATWLLPEDPDYEQLLGQIQQSAFSDASPVDIQPELWKKVFTQYPGVELAFPDDVSLEYLDTFFNESLSQYFPILQLSSVSRVWFFYNQENRQSFAWFISDEDQQIVQVQASFKKTNLETMLAKLGNRSSPALVPVPANRKNPWEPANENEPFARMFYLPDTSLPIVKKTYKLENISPNTMIGWLFKDPDVRPIPINKNEDLYMYDEQMMTVNKTENFMVYSETVDEQDGEMLPLEQQLKAVNNFVQRPHGWTGNYLLDQVETGENAFSEFTFRLYMNGYPVYWPEGDLIHPDEIKVQTNPIDKVVNVNKYHRSLLYLAGNPQQKRQTLPDRETLLGELAKRKIPLTSVKRIYPGYQADSSNKNKQVKLTPVWVVKTLSGQQTLISSP